MSAPVKTPECCVTREELLREDSNLRLLNDCPACLLLGVRCLIASHPSSAGMSYTFPICICFHALWFFFPIHSSSAPPYRITIRNSYSVTAGGAGNGSVRIFLAVCAYSFFHDISPWRDGKIASCFLLVCFTFHLFAFTVLFSFFSIALFYTPIASPCRHAGYHAELPFRPYRQSR